MIQDIPGGMRRAKRTAQWLEIKEVVRTQGKILVLVCRSRGRNSLDSPMGRYRMVRRLRQLPPRLVRLLQRRPLILRASLQQNLRLLSLQGLIGGIGGLAS